MNYSCVVRMPNFNEYLNFWLIDGCNKCGMCHVRPQAIPVRSKAGAEAAQGLLEALYDVTWHSWRDVTTKNISGGPIWCDILGGPVWHGVALQDVLCGVTWHSRRPCVALRGTPGTLFDVMWRDVTLLGPVWRYVTWRVSPGGGRSDPGPGSAGGRVPSIGRDQEARWTSRRSRCLDLQTVVSMCAVCPMLTRLPSLLALLKCLPQIGMI